MAISRQMFSRFLDTVGDGSGTTNAVGNYSGGEEVFFIAPAITENFEVSRMIVSAEDTTGFQAQEYGNLGSALGTGIVVRVSDADGVKFILTEEPVTTNANWGTYCFDADVKSWGSGNELLLARWTFALSGTPVRLNPGDKLEVVLNDDFSGLISHRFLTQGVTQVTNVSVD